MYGLPIIHKNNTPLRPIISAIRTYNYFTAKYLVEFLTLLLDSDEFILKDTFDFVNKVSTINTKVDKTMCSFDVESLFTNIPTLETIEIILKRAFEEVNDYFHGLSRDQLKKLLIICTQESHFKFNGKYYDQKDGVSMGSPLGPLMANIFIANFENKHMTSLKGLGVNLWFKYVDDVFATTKNSNTSKYIRIPVYSNT